MKLEQQVCSLDLAKRLKESGVKQESCFYWWRRTENSEWLILHYNSLDIPNRERKYQEFTSAFTVAELGELLPLNVMPESHRKITYSNGYWLECHKENSQWNVSYRTGRRIELCFKVSDTEADARAQMLCYLLENKLITLAPS
jgi:hypothetical protein